MIHLWLFVSAKPVQIKKSWYKLKWGWQLSLASTVWRLLSKNFQHKNYYYERTHIQPRLVVDVVTLSVMEKKSGVDRSHPFPRSRLAPKSILDYLKICITFCSTVHAVLSENKHWLRCLKLHLLAHSELRRGYEPTETCAKKKNHYRLLYLGNLGSAVSQSDETPAVTTLDVLAWLFSCQPSPSRRGEWVDRFLWDH